ncbi:DUF6717 family protein [Flaviaesturariibacter amylovorans]|uniref:Uncharacterized protein n=1 Tax=Flaviaesturariibacter amylovorans TaxID=1084520 RepID=A0ABP8HH61_9BACT
MQRHTFIRQFGGWYIDLPEYIAQGGSKADLAMVAGADTLLDMIAAGHDQVTLDIDAAPFEGADELRLLRVCAPETGGGDYVMEAFEGRRIDQELWLCDVTLFVFGDLPERVYIRRVA